MTYHSDYLVIDDKDLMSKYAKKTQNHDKNIYLKKEIIKLLNHEKKQVIVKYATPTQATNYRTIAVKFLKQINRLDGIDVQREKEYLKIWRNI